MIKILAISLGLFLICSDIRVTPLPTQQKLTASPWKSIEGGQKTLRQFQYLTNKTVLPFLSDCYSVNCCIKGEQIFCPSYFEMIMRLNHTNLLANLTENDVLNLYQAKQDMNQDVVDQFCKNFSKMIPTPKYNWSGTDIRERIQKPAYCVSVCTESRLSETGEDVVFVLKPFCKMISWMASIMPNEAPNVVVNEGKPSGLDGNHDVKLVDKIKEHSSTVSVSVQQQGGDENKKAVTQPQVETLKEKNDLQQKEQVPKPIKEEKLLPTEKSALDTKTPEVKVDVEPNNNQQINVNNPIPVNNIDPILNNKKPLLAVEPPAAGVQLNNNQPITNDDTIPTKKPALDADDNNHILASDEIPIPPEQPLDAEGLQPNNPAKGNSGVMGKTANSEISLGKPSNSQETERNVEINQDDPDDVFQQDQKSDQLQIYSNEDDTDGDDLPPSQVDTKQLPKEPTIEEVIETNSHEIMQKAGVGVSANYIPASDPFYEEAGSNFFTYFLAGMFICILLYVLYHNKAKILALILEGRRSQKGRGGRRKHTAQYRKLDTNLEEAITSSTSGRSTQIIY